jgi:hypothetical protein
VTILSSLCRARVCKLSYGPSKEVMEKWPETRQETVREQWDVKPLNIRALDDVDITLLPIKWSEECTEGYLLD